jgi:hypothetical protein
VKRLRIIFVNVLVFVVLLAIMEIAGRVYVHWTRGSQTAGMQERTVYLSYEPFVMYGPSWDQELAPTRWPPRLGVCRVLLVGGSTAAGFPGKILEQALSRQIESRTFEVINAALGGYEARQEVVVASLWGPSLRPDVLLSLDGANDLEHRLRVPKAGEFYLSSTYALYLKRPWLAPFSALLTNSQLYNGIVRLVQRRSVNSPEYYADAIPVYIESQHSLNVLAKGMGALRLMVLQPFSAYKTHQSPEESAFQLYKYREEVLKTLYERTSDQLSAVAARDEVRYLDGRHIYQGVAEHIFIDDVHLTPRGYERLADAIARALVREASDAKCIPRRPVN